MKENIWKKYNDQEKTKIMEMAEDYKNFLSLGKTERECNREIIRRAEKVGFENINEYISGKLKIYPGAKIYADNRGKAVALFIIGKEEITKGMNILGAHIDSPRLDLKANPLYEDNDFAYFDTHYYGGIKKYQWVTIPLALHGVIVKKDGTSINVNIGEKDGDPVFCITDLLPHLANEQMKKDASKLIEGEALDVLIGNVPGDDDKETVKRNILEILKETYDITEEDFLSAEIEVVPAGKARDLGIDRSMVLAYGQDDRSCAYSSLRAFLEMENPVKTVSCILVDKEEIGSVGATGMESLFYENMVAEICKLLGEESFVALRRVFANSKMLSSDVNAAYDPLYASVMDKRNSSYLARGLVFCKYTGSRGKNSSNDADAEYLAELRRIMDDNNIAFQVSELGKVDAGGGGTIAYILANYDVKVVDCGIGILSMHAPFEVASKVDIYEAYRGYLAFIRNA
ncbi:MAG TPA: aminopeptidase [Candidatus Onthousia faecavium]|nr:aminopeptidase [Candidatus Onthousia faecavium]